MTFKTWEKIYWAIIGFVSFLFCLPVFGLGKVTYEGKEVKVGEGISYGTYFGYLAVFVLTLGILWVIIRLIVNKGWEDKGRGNK